MRLWGLGLLAGVLVIWQVQDVRADCVLPPPLAKYFELRSKVVTGPEIKIELGLAQVDVPSCLASARATFQALLTGSDDHPRHLAEGVLALIAARELAQRGEVVAAAKALRDVAAKYEEWAVYLRAVQDLAFLLDSRATAPEWQFLSHELEKIAAAEDVSGMAAIATGHLAMHDITTGRAGEGLDAMETYLAKPHSAQIRLNASIIYLELLLAAGHRADIRVLSYAIEDEVGRMDLEPAMRVRFLQVCVAAYSNLADPQSRARYQRYATALEQARREIQ